MWIAIALRSPHESCINEKIATKKLVARERRNKIRSLIKGISSPNTGLSDKFLKDAVIMLLKEI
jgi:hypothetical protein